MKTQDDRERRKEADVSAKTLVERTCGVCRLPIHESETGIRHFGTSIAHSARRCIDLLTERASQAERERDAAIELLTFYSHESHLQTFEDRERFRKAARALLERKE